MRLPAGRGNEHGVCGMHVSSKLADGRINKKTLSPPWTGHPLARQKAGLKNMAGSKTDVNLR
jgi:hypothetical protein